jgi:hypothetical protein
LDKQCTCTNGTGAAGTACHTHGTAKCALCSGAFFLDGTSCRPHVVDCDAQGKVVATAASNTVDAVCGAPKQCTCAHGTGAVGTACPANSAAKCMSCSGAFFINNDACLAWTTCDNTEHEATAPSNTADRVCAAHATCTASQFVSKAPTATSSRECTGRGACANGSLIAAAAATQANHCGACSIGYHVEGANCVITPVQGGWSGWSSWSGCSKDCGSGTKDRSRSCSNPSPARGGASCSGAGSESTSCNTHECVAGKEAGKCIQTPTSNSAFWNRVTAPFQYCFANCPRLCKEKCIAHGYDFFGLECAGQNDPGSMHCACYASFPTWAPIRATSDCTSDNIYSGHGCSGLLIGGVRKFTVDGYHLGSAYRQMVYPVTA